MRLLSLLFSVLLLVGSVYADENIVDYSDTSLPVLNEELRNLHDGIRNTHSIPSGGTAGQVLVKDTATNYDTSWATIPTHGSQVFTSSGTFTAPAGVTQVCISGSGAGGGGGAGAASNTVGGGGGASGKCLTNYPYTVVSTTVYTVTLNNGGTGGVGTGSNGTAGGASVFDTLTLAGGLGGTGGAATAGISDPNMTVLGLSIAGVLVLSAGYGQDGGSGLFGAGGAGGAPGAGGSAGGVGVIYGGGGGGGGGRTASTGWSGGNGTKGIIIVSW